MNYESAKGQATYLTGIRKVNHIIYQLNGQYHVAIEGQYTGAASEIILYKEPTEFIDKKVETKSKSKQVQDISDVPGVTTEEVL